MDESDEVWNGFPEWINMDMEAHAMRSGQFESPEAFHMWVVETLRPDAFLLPASIDVYVALISFLKSQKDYAALTRVEQRVRRVVL